MSRISADDAFLMLAKWSEERAAIQVVMLRAALPRSGQRAASTAVVSQVLPHSQKALLTLRDGNGEDVGVTVSLEGAEWEYTGAGCSPLEKEGAGAILPEFAEMNWVCYLAATFPNGNQYVFGERATSA